MSRGTRGTRPNNITKQSLSQPVRLTEEDEGLLMLIKRDFTSLDHERFRRDCGFLPEEREIFDLLVQGKLIKEIVCQTGMPEATVNRRIKRIKDRILKVL